MRALAPRAVANAALTTPREAWVFLAKPVLPLCSSRPPAKNIFWLDADGDLTRVAHRLFAVLRKLDRAGFAQLHD